MLIKKEMGNTLESVLSNQIISDINQKKEQCLIYLIKNLIGHEINSKIWGRVFCLKFEDWQHYERYVWDYGKKTERFLMEWDLVFPPLDIKNITYIPTIEVNCPLSLKGIL